MRCFIAVDLPETVKQSIGAVVDKAKATSALVRWVPLRNIHLTLKFLGEVEDTLLPAVEERLSVLCADHARFALTAAGTGAFPNHKHPAALWIGLNESEELRSLARDIEQTMHELGFEKEDRKFSPHLTIGRVKERKDIESAMRELATFRDTVFGSIDVDEVLLMKSQLKPGGAEYSRVAGFKLKKALSSP